MKTIYSILFIIYTVSTFAQFSLQGKIIDDKKEPIPFATITLLQIDNTIYKGVISNDDGAFLIPNITKGNYHLKVSFIGFLDTTLSIHITENRTLETIVLKENSEKLEEVILTYKKPTVTRKIDRLVFNVANTILSSGNAWEVLKNTPGVIINQDNILIKNSGNNIILINDKRVYLSNAELKNLLETTSAEDITSVEVITNPPAKYEAEGNAVLNIKMKKNIITGYKGSINTMFKKARFSSGNIGTSHYYKNKKINIYVNYSHNRGKGNRLEEEVISFNNDTSASIYQSFLDRNSTYRSHNFRLNSDFYVNKKSILSLGSQLYYSPDWKGNNTTDSKIFLPNNTLSSSFFTTNNSGNFRKDFGLDVDYQLKIDDKKKLEISTHFTDYKNEGNQLINTDFFNNQNQPVNNKTFSTNSFQTTKIYNTQIDFQNEINDSTKFKTGFKFSDVKSLTNLEHYNIENSQSILDTTKSNNFNYNETNIAGYLSYQTSFGKINIKAGLRGEYTSLLGASKTLQEINKNSYFKLFPTFYLQYSPNQTHEFGLSYGKRISRPQYSSLNPFKFYFGDYSFFEGNPNLRPAISHNVSAQYTLQKKYNFDIYYSKTLDYITEVNYQNNNTNTLQFTNINVANKKDFGISFNTNFSLSEQWSINTYHSVGYNEDLFSDIENNNQLVENSIWQYYGYISSNYQFLKDRSLTAELSYRYNTDNIQGSLQVEGSQDLSLGLTKKVFNNKATLSVQFSDILKSQVIKISTLYGNQNNYFIDDQETQYIRIGFRYNFGNQLLKKKGYKEKTDEKNRL